MQAGMLESEIKAGIKLPLVEMRQRRETFLLQKEKILLRTRDYNSQKRHSRFASRK